MSTMLAGLLGRRRLILATALLMFVAGVAAWFTMPREEDPQFPSRDGLVIVNFPGADAETVERLVVEPIEERLAEVQEVGEVVSASRAGVAVVNITLLDAIYETERAWDEVREGLVKAERDFPAGTSRAVLDDELVRQEAVVLAITGSVDPLVLGAAAERVRRVLLALQPVREVRLLGDPGEQITVAYDDATARRLGIDPRQLGAQLASRSTIIPGGIVHLGDKTVNLRPETDFQSLDDLANTPIVLPSGASVPLASLARVHHGPREPAVERMRWNGEMAVGLGVVPKYNLDRVTFGIEVRETLASLAPDLAPLEVQEVEFQPDQVAQRIGGLSRSLMFGIMIVAAVLFAFMGPRLGLLVVLVVPLVTFASVAVFATGGGILHQISIAALVIALGMLVDNAIVVAEGIQYRIDRGEPRSQASVATVKELAMPLGTATGTTLAAFVPMALSKGPTADFTRSVPILIMLTLTVSYLFAVLVTPVLAELLLARRQPPDQNSRAARLSEGIAQLAVGRPWLVLMGVGVLLLISMLLAGQVSQQFFPSGDRAMLVVDLELPEGTHLEATSDAAEQLEHALSANPDVLSVAAFIGRAVPRFYYNLRGRFNSPHLSQMMVRTVSLDAVPRVSEWLRDYVARELPGVEVVARRLEQGPPADAPIELRIFGHDLEDLVLAAELVEAEVRAQPETRDVRRTIGLGVPNVVFEIDDAAAGRHGLARRDVGLALLGRTLGAEVGQYRLGEDPVPILVRSSAGEQFPIADLATVDVATPGARAVPLEQVARLGVEWRPAAIHHRNGRREVRVLSQLAEGVTFSEVLTRLMPRLDELDLPLGVEIAVAGEAAESGQANKAILRALPLGTLLLLFFLLVEFNSFRRVAIILATVPLAAVGVVPGLLLSGQPFGFMSVLGVFSLVGIVVNNAIVLIDRVETQRAAGRTIDEALRNAIQRRARPILLTMATTVAGLTPLAFSETSLWPPLAWAMISGLIASTLLTLAAIPALYKIVFGLGHGTWARGRTSAAVATLLALMLAAPPEARANEVENADTRLPETVSLEEAMRRAVDRPLARASTARTAATEDAAEAIRRAARWPTLGVVVEATIRDRDFDIGTPLGSLRLGNRESGALGAEVVVPLIDRANRRFSTDAAARRARASAQLEKRDHRQLAAEAARRFLDVLAIDARREATGAFVASLEARLAEAEARIAAGRTLEADALKVRLDLEAAVLDLERLARGRTLATETLGWAIGFGGPVEPTLDTKLERPAPPELNGLIEQALEHRTDLAAVATQSEALALEARAVRATRLPRLEARGTWSATEGDPFRPESLGQAGLHLRWTPFAAGTRRPQKDALDHQRQALESELASLRRAVALEVERAYIAVVDAREAVPVRERGVELATETLRVEQERHRAGRATTNDLLVAVAKLRDQRTARDLARLDVVRAWVALDLAREGL